MPIFEYVCRGCQTRFEKIVQASTQPACPSCRGTSLEQQFSTFSVRKGSTLYKQQPAGGACGACGDPRGAGACRLD